MHRLAIEHARDCLADAHRDPTPDGFRASVRAVQTAWSDVFDAAAIDRADVAEDAAFLENAILELLGSFGCRDEIAPGDSLIQLRWHARLFARLRLHGVEAVGELIEQAVDSLTNGKTLKEVVDETDNWSRVERPVSAG